MKTKDELLEERTEPINGFSVKKRIKSGEYIVVQPACFIEQNRCLIDKERGGIFMWSREKKRYFLIAKVNNQSN